MATVLDIGVDLGTSSVVIHGKGKGSVLNEPAVIAIDRDTRNVLAVGEDAHRMLGRAPGNIQVMRPLAEGMIADFDLASAMLRFFVTKVVGKHLIGGPRVLLSVPNGVNEAERHQLISALFEAGARRTFLMERPIAAALGAGLPIGDASGQMIVDIGGGVTEIAVISMGRMVVRENVKLGGDAFDDAIIKYLRRKHNFLVGPITAEDLKITIGSAIARNEQFYMEVTGRSLLTGLPKLMHITSDEITEAMAGPLQSLLEAIHGVLEHTPAELVSDISESGIVLTGGGALLSGLCEAIQISLKIDCRLAEDAQECGARGCCMTLEGWQEYSRFLGDRKKR
ncbi:MAG: rod shape-determining protein [Clostridia bacterium]|nr:rod shape-determining protein [Clostridia bacterium]